MIGWPNTGNVEYVAVIAAVNERRENMRMLFKKALLTCFLVTFVQFGARAECILLGDKKPENCMNESSGKHCECLSVENKCTYEVTVKYATSKRSGSFDLGKGKKDSSSACTGAENDTVRYVGEKKTN